MTKTHTLSDTQPQAVMTEEEITEWERLPASEQLLRLRAAIARGVRSGPAKRTMDEILQSVLDRHLDAKS